jgi:hypothetical protein
MKIKQLFCKHTLKRDQGTINLQVGGLGYCGLRCVKCGKRYNADVSLHQTRLPMPALEEDVEYIMEAVIKNGEFKKVKIYSKTFDPQEK